MTFNLQSDLHVRMHTDSLHTELIQKNIARQLLKETGFNLMPLLNSL